MSKSWYRWSSAFVCCALIGLYGCSHEEHPKGNGKKEHPNGKDGKEHPDKKDGKGTDAKKTGGVSNEELARVIEESAGKGTFNFTDPDTGRTLAITLDRIHKDRFAKTAPDTYFACADFKDDRGNTYDLDFWVKLNNGQPLVVETHLHKDNGKERYTWQLEDGVWKRVFKSVRRLPGSGTKGRGGNEHPEKAQEHPANLKK